MARMRRVMHRTRVLIAVLLFAALVVVPTIDAFACGIEPVASTAVQAGQAGHEEGGDHQLGVCGHNHCHHAGANVLADLDPLGLAASRQLPGEHLRAFALTALIDNLMRPPRV